MVQNHKVTGTASSMASGLALAALCSILITVLGSVLSANLVLNGMIPEKSIGYCSMVILLVSSAAGGLTAMARIKHRLLFVCIVSGIIYYLTLLGAGLFLFGGQLQGMGATALMVLCGSGTVALLGAKGKSSGKKGRRRGYRS